jgi:hypothetical protein
MNVANWHRNTCLLALNLSVDHMLREGDRTEKPNRSQTDRGNGKESYLSSSRPDMQTRTEQTIAALSRHRSLKQTN